jgi:cysteinylglycine-S-conjugate dipeptidase
LIEREDAEWPTEGFAYGRRTLDELTCIPSVSLDPKACDAMVRAAETVTQLLRAAGIAKARVVTVPGAKPAVVGFRPGPSDTPVVLLYAHYDVIPASADQTWRTPPFIPTERNGRLYGRGTSDDKAGIAIHLAALRAHDGSPPVGISVLIEGEEEIGSPNLAKILAEARAGMPAPGFLGTPAEHAS